MSGKIEKIIAVKAIYEDQLTSGLSKSNSMLTSFNNEVKKTTAATSKATGSQVKLGASAGKTGGAFNKLNGILGKSSAQGQKLFASFGPKASKAFQNLGGALGNFGGKIKGLIPSLGGLGGGLSGLGGVLGTLGGFLGTATGLVTAFAASLVAASAAVLGFTGKIANMADDVGKAAQRMGVSIEFYQKMGSAAQHAGTSISTMENSMRAMLMKMTQVEQGNKLATKAFNDLGVSVLDSSGKMRNQEDVYADTLIALAGMENATARNAKAQEVLGRQASQLAPMFNEGEDAVRKYLSANSSAVIISGKLAKSSEKYNDTMQTLSETFKQAKNKALEPFMEAMAKWAENIRPQEVEKWGKALGTATTWLLKLGAEALLVTDIIVNAFVFTSDAIALAIAGIGNTFDQLWPAIITGYNFVSNGLKLAFYGALEAVNAAITFSVNKLAEIWSYAPGGTPEWLKGIVKGQEESTKFYKDVREQSIEQLDADIEADVARLKSKQTYHNGVYKEILSEMGANQEAASKRQGALLRYIMGLEQVKDGVEDVGDEEETNLKKLKKNVDLVASLKDKYRLLAMTINAMANQNKENKYFRDSNTQVNQLVAKLAKASGARYKIKLNLPEQVFGDIESLEKRLDNIKNPPAPGITRIANAGSTQEKMPEVTGSTEAVSAYYQSRILLENKFRDDIESLTLEREQKRLNIQKKIAVQAEALVVEKSRATTDIEKNAIEDKIKKTIELQAIYEDKLDKEYDYKVKQAEKIKTLDEKIAEKKLQKTNLLDVTVPDSNETIDAFRAFFTDVREALYEESEEPISIFTLLFGGVENMSEQQERVKSQIIMGLQEVYAAAQSLANAFGDIRKVKDANEIKALKAKQKKELDEFKGSAKAKKEFQAKQDKELEAMKQEQFEKDKRAQIAQVWVSVAGSIVQMWAKFLSAFAGPQVGVGIGLAAAMTALLTGTAIAQTAAISQQKLEDGGVVGGFMGATEGPDNVDVKARKGEMYINAKQQRNVYDAINTGAFGSSGDVVVNRGDIIIQGNVTEEHLDAIRQVDDDFLYKLKNGIETLQGSGEVSFA